MFKILIQRVTRNLNAPTNHELKRWVKAALEGRMATAELTIRLVDKEEMTALNSQFRHKQGPTNVLSFPFDTTDDFELDTPLLGDIVICTEVVNQEAIAQQKTATAHWAHMVVHGTLHLLGYDHVVDTDAEKMEAEEIHILQSLGFENPYLLTKVIPHE